jgi:hypothetical protein
MASEKVGALRDEAADPLGPRPARETMEGPHRKGGSEEQTLRIARAEASGAERPRPSLMG